MYKKTACDLAMFTSNPESYLCPGLFQKNHDQQVEGLILFLNSTLLRSYLEYCVFIWNPQYRKDTLDLLE